MEAKREEMSHDDAWDDSALINSWNEALDEYKKYHSIHASGGLIRLEEDEQAPSVTRTETMLETQVGSRRTDRPPGSEGKTQPSHDVSPRTGFHNDGESSASAPPIAPQSLLRSVQDEGLKRLLMSWYYAGYYTGLYEGQQKKQETPSLDKV